MTGETLERQFSILREMDTLGASSEAEIEALESKHGLILPAPFRTLIGLCCISRLFGSSLDACFEWKNEIQNDPT